MPVLNPNAPYDTLATVTQMVRTALADYVQNIQPNLFGAVNTNNLAVTWMSGNKFNFLMNGQPITIGGTPYLVDRVTSAVALTLVNSAGVQANVDYSAVLPTGDIFSDSQNYVVPTVNLAWRKLQKKLADKGHPRLKSEALLLNFPVITNLDPASQQWMSWGQFFDGTNFLTVPNAPVLPPNFISPLHLWERPSGMTVEFAPMHPAGNGLWPRNKTSWNKCFDWREDALYFPGSLLNMDVRMSFKSFLADIVVGTGDTFAQTQIPITRCGDGLAYYTAEIFVQGRGGDALAPSFASKGDAAIDQITNDWAKLQQRSSFHRQAWGGRGRRGRYLMGR